MIPRINPYLWKKRDELTHDQVNQLDDNATYGLDKRDGYADTLASHITVTGSVEFSDLAELTLDNPGSFSVVNDGYLSIAAEIRGDTRSGRKDPLRLGYQTVTLVGGDQTLTDAEMTTQVVKLIGTVDGDNTITLPAISGYAKIIDNQATYDGTPQQGFSLTLKAAGGTNLLSILQNSSQWVYCDGTDLFFGPKKSLLELIDYVTQSDGYSFASPTYQSISSSVLGLVTGYADIFTCQTNDVLEISYTAGSKPSATALAYLEIIVRVTKPDTTSVDLTETTFANQNVGTPTVDYASFTTLYVCPADGNFTVSLYAASSAGTGTVTLPLILTVKQLR